MAKKKVDAATEETTAPPAGEKGEVVIDKVKPEKVEKATPKKETSKPEGKKGEDGGEKKTTFTQEEVNTLLGKVRGEARDTATKAFLDDMGAESADDLKSSLKKLADIERESLTEQERLLADLNTAQTELEKAKESESKSTKFARRATINAEIARYAANRFQSVDAVLKLINRDNLDVGDDGSVTGVEEALGEVEANYPFTLQKEGVSVTSPANPSGGKDTPERTDEQRKAEYFGMGQADDFWEGQEMRQIAEE